MEGKNIAKNRINFKENFQEQCSRWIEIDASKAHDLCCSSRALDWSKQFCKKDSGWRQPSYFCLSLVA